SINDWQIEKRLQMNLENYCAPLTHLLIEIITTSEEQGNVDPGTNHRMACLCTLIFESVCDLKTYDVVINQVKGFAPVDSNNPSQNPPPKLNKISLIRLHCNDRKFYNGYCMDCYFNQPSNGIERGHFQQFH
ncbi:Hypothetical predicted protein, partial [Paramuricea clavata]